MNIEWMLTACVVCDSYEELDTANHHANRQQWVLGTSTDRSDGLPREGRRQVKLYIANKGPDLLLHVALPSYSEESRSSGSVHGREIHV